MMGGVANFNNALTLGANGTLNLYGGNAKYCGDQPGGHGCTKLRRGHTQVD